MSLLKWTLLVLACLAVVAAVTILVAQRSWRTAVAALDAELRAQHAATVPLPASDLPEPVARYLARAVPPTTPPITYATLHQRGTFQMSEGEAGWRPFSATEVFRVHPPAYYWDARIGAAPGASAYVRDSYLSGSARMLGRIGGLVTVVDERQSPALATSALARYLAEAVWFPTRLAVGPGLTWRAVDEQRATAVLEDGDVSVSLTFTFNANGDPVRVEGMRDRATDSGFVSTLWVGTFAEHETVGGYRIPRYGEVGWMVDGSLQLYWRGRIETAEYR